MPPRIDPADLVAYYRSLGIEASALDPVSFEWGAALSASASAQPSSRPPKGSPEAKARMAKVRAAKKTRRKK